MKNRFNWRFFQKLLNAFVICSLIMIASGLTTVTPVLAAYDCVPQPPFDPIYIPLPTNGSAWNSGDRCIDIGKYQKYKSDLDEWIYVNNAISLAELHGDGLIYTISGNAGLAGATLSYMEGTSKTTTADSSGEYTFTVSYDWSGTVTPSKMGYTFTPIRKTYINVVVNQTAQTYITTMTIWKVYLPNILK